MCDEAREAAESDLRVSVKRGKVSKAKWRSVHAPVLSIRAAA